MHQFATGIRDVGRGFAALRAHPALWAWVIAPAVITAALIGLLIAGIAHLVGPVDHWAAAHLPGVLAHVAGSVLQVAVVVALSAGAWLVFVPIAGLVTGPFAERLSEHLEAELTGAPSAAFSLGEFLHGLALALAHGLRRLLAMVAGLVVVFAIGLAPVVGTIAAPLAAVWFAAVAAAYDCYDSVLARRMLSYRDKLGYLADHRARTLGLGAAVATMLLVPGLNLIALGLGTAGATVAAHELAAARPHRALR